MDEVNGLAKSVQDRCAAFGSLGSQKQFEGLATHGLKPNAALWFVQTQLLALFRWQEAGVWCMQDELAVEMRLSGIRQFFRFSLADHPLPRRQTGLLLSFGACLVATQQLQRLLLGALQYDAPQPASPAGPGDRYQVWVEQWRQFVPWLVLQLLRQIFVDGPDLSLGNGTDIRAARGRNTAA